MPPMSNPDQASNTSPLVDKPNKSGWGSSGTDGPAYDDEDADLEIGLPIRMESGTHNA